MSNLGPQFQQLKLFMSPREIGLMAQSEADPDRLMPVIHSTWQDWKYHGRRRGGNDIDATYRTFRMG